MIRVLHYGLDSRLGGIETYLYKIYTHINRNSFKFDFLTIGKEDPIWINEFTEMGSRFYKITSRKENAFKNIFELKNLFKNERFDVVHCHMNTLSYIAPVKIALKSQVPVIIHSRNAGATHSVITNLLHNINSINLPKYKIKKIAVSDLAGEWLFGQGTNFQVINNGVDIEKFAFDENKRNTIRKELGIKDELTIIHVGAMREQKNHIFLVDIFHEVHKRQPNSKLILIGDGVLKEQIVNRIKKLGLQDHIILTGIKHNISDYLSAADLFLFPSLFEGFPNAVIEAETSGLPCLISDVITKEVLINDSCYSISLGSDSKAWADKLLSISINNTRKDSAQKIRNKGFSVEEEIKKISSIYWDVVNSNIKY